jgi:hypothetical protein
MGFRNFNFESYAYVTSNMVYTSKEWLSGPNQLLKRMSTGRSRCRWMKAFHDAMEEIKMKGQWKDREEW